MNALQPVRFGDQRLPERWWAKVRVQPSGCWEWTASLTADGYGRYRSNGQPIRAHRVAYAALVGAIPDGLHVLHGCDHRPCVNPAHLRAGTREDNMRDSVERGRHHEARVARCPQGHLYDEANTYHSPSGRRECRTCRRERSLRWFRRNIGFKPAKGEAR